ncbi:hypothetical protein O181_010649 [Austropuccinia psidii MF-1]|uniref:Integrase catalytic domain-containing protein n=1 Tax=Austropuccinia psidii MF-1 TaxID=1389203 RepID=A0A9Q3GL26_9BASI|nr:hypothetical protein [Austropuccinia psidii MF-1]
MCTTHTKEACFAENPHIRTTHFDNKRKTRSYQNPSAHLSTTQALVTGKIFNETSEELIIDCGSTHHMFNSRSLFSYFVETTPMAVSTGDSTRSLFSKGSGTISLLINNKAFVLKESLFDPNLNCNIISLMRLCNGDMTISRSSLHFKLIIGEQDFKALAKLKGFVHVFSPPETPQHNGYAERANRTILDKTRCLINSSGLPNYYWAEALNTAVFLSNLIPTPSRLNLSPYGLWTVNSPRTKKLCVFGCHAVVSLPRIHRDWKLGPVGQTGVLLGYENDNSSYWVLQLRNRKILISKHVKFEESDFPFVQPCLPAGMPKATENNDNLVVGKMDGTLHPDSVEVVDEPHLTEDVEAKALDEVCSSSPDCNSRRVDESPFPSGDPNTASESTTNGDINQENILTYSRRQRTLLTKTANVPKTFRSALKGPLSDEWSKAIEKELGAMVDLNVLDVIDLKAEFKLVRTTWVFWVKTNHLKEVVEYKAQLCAQGFSQTPGVDFGKTYAPTGRLNSLRCLISHAVLNDLSFHQVDVKSAFLNAPLTEVVYLSIPQGVDVDKRNYCLHLKKAIYGLKQAPLAWYNSLKAWLAEVGFSVCISDPSIFGKDVSTFKGELKAKFDIKDIGVADLMLGIKNPRTRWSNLTRLGSTIEERWEASIITVLAQGQTSPMLSVAVLSFWRGLATLNSKLFFMFSGILREHLMYCRIVDLCQILLHLLTFLFRIQTPVLLITVVAVPIILVISCPPFSLAFLHQVELLALLITLMLLY